MLDHCWNDIGVWSDATPSCPRLAEVIHCQNCDVFARAGRGLLDRAAPEGHLEAWSDALAQEKEISGDDRLALFVFRVGSEWLALPMSSVKEVAEPLPVRTLPRRSGGLLAGLVNVRGELHLAFSMTTLLGVEQNETSDVPHAYPRTIVIGDDAGRWVFPADEAWGTLSARASALGEVPVTIARDSAAHVRGILDWERGKISCLDEKLLFATLQRRATHG